MRKRVAVELREWDGRTYRRWPESPRESDRTYFQRHANGRAEYLHRAVWSAAHGPIPPGHHVHHRDGNPANNALDNLECVSAAEHIARHPYDAERLARQLTHLDAIRPLTKDWHRSEAGRAWHRANGARAYTTFRSTPKRCEQCGQTFTPRKIGNGDRFCGNACKSAYRRASGVDDEQRVCVQCGGNFTVNRYRKTRACSRSCANRYRARG